MAATNQKFSVALHIMAGLAFYRERHITSGDLASSVNATPSVVRQVLSKLSKHGLVLTTEGRNGSCTLARKPEKITLLDVYKAVEPPAVFAIHGYPAKSSCVVSSTIKQVTGDVLGKGQHAFEQSLRQQTVAELTHAIAAH
ncbi:MAG: Rrf2 family transcriptional regulator [Janthinobacterium lividum]